MNWNSIAAPSVQSSKLYQFGFILCTSIGNNTRYQVLRKYAEQDPDVECHWAPVKHYLEPGQLDPFRYIPEPFHMRCVGLYEASPLLGRLGQVDAVMIHLLEAVVAASVRSLFPGGPLIVNAHDDPPMIDPAHYPLYDDHKAKMSLRRVVRMSVDKWCASRTGLFIPYSQWGGESWLRVGVPREKVHPIHVGIDLPVWDAHPRPPREGGKPKILFVGGDFARKGGYLLLEVFGQRFADVAELHLVTRTAPDQLPPNTFVYTDLTPNDPRLIGLFAQADMFVLPTAADFSSFASLEAMAFGCPVISTQVGGIPDIVRQGQTGFTIPPRDAIALAEAMQTLLSQPELRRQMGQAGRKLVEQEFNAAVNVPKMLAVMKQAVDQRRSRSRTAAIAPNPS